MRLTIADDVSNFPLGSEVRIEDGSRLALVLWYLKRPLQWLGILPRYWVLEACKRNNVLILEKKRFPTYEQN